MRAFHNYRATFQNILSNVVARGPHAASAGVFGTACFQHEESCRDFDFERITIDGQTPATAFTAWYGAVTGVPGTATRDIPASKWVYFDGAWPSDTSCTSGHHGGC
eukprot:NODE_6720_length_823_cov_67.655714_g6484_i0.p1 GENE.NODE_6720_length_823_cov_67.655714_g6484_i0~~NODE_6720_length_823_cov_67.655714_g6484_i0.p1  ORF type:complete len:106 (+),score=9.21 NODE_6720_length_823_cov_67.655714_g6484_i0:432-749(+)